MYDLQSDPWELTNVADRPEYAEVVRDLARVLVGWIDQTGDFPAWVRVRDDNVERVTGVKFADENPPMREVVIPAAVSETRQGPSR